MIEAIVGALVGAIIGGFISWVAAVRVTKQQTEASIKQAQDERIWEVALNFSEIIGDLLTLDTLKQLRTPAKKRELERKWESNYKRFYIVIGDSVTARQLLDIMRSYIHECMNFSGGEKEMERLKNRRLEVRDQAAKLMSKCRLGERSRLLLE